jgi:hypothetical protein
MKETTSALFFPILDNVLHSWRSLSLIRLSDQTSFDEIFQLKVDSFECDSLVSVVHEKEECWSKDVASS